VKPSILFSAILAAGLLVAHEGEEHGKAVTITGQVVDTGCYMVHNGKGAEHAMCAETCAKAGVPLAILDDKGKLYLSLAADHKNPNTKLMPFIEKKVKITGTLVEKGGISGISIKTVAAAQ
jgi:hypothetical protein